MNDRPISRHEALQQGFHDGYPAGELNARYGEQPGPHSPDHHAAHPHEYEAGFAAGVEQYELDEPTDTENQT